MLSMKGKEHQSSFVLPAAQLCCSGISELATVCVDPHLATSATATVSVNSRT